jgi:hypothetical protein
LNGLPDPNTVLASFELSHEGDQRTYTYEYARMSLLSGPGTYFALFRSQQEGDSGIILANAFSPAGTGKEIYRAAVVTMGVLIDPAWLGLEPGTAYVPRVQEFEMAVRLLGTEV